jgi:putative ABC transport system permease protein
MQQIPGIVSAGLATAIPMGTVNVSLAIELPDHPGQEIVNNFKSVSPGYFETLGIPLRAGRMLSERDDASSQPVALINETFARRYWPGQNAVGKSLGHGIAVVGVVADTRGRMLSEPPAPEFYQSYRQFIGPALGAMIVARTRGDPARLAQALTQAIHRIYPDQPVPDVRTMEARVASSMADTRLYSILLGSFAAIALVLTVIGIYGVLAYAVGHRTREFAIRMAIGATRADVVRAVMRGGMGLILAGSALGLTVAFMLRRYVASLVFGVSPADPATFAGAIAVMASVALIACYVPAWRATSIDPNAALREE